MASIEMLHSVTDSNSNIDPTRVIEGVITGIGFLGAGAMFREGNFVQGAGSAAAIWVAGAIGLTCGLGELWLAIAIAGIVLILLVASGPFTAKWDPGEEIKTAARLASLAHRTRMAQYPSRAKRSFRHEGRPWP
jgi:putative Mg2+ transporter-C (MgtC) family protein